MDKCIDTQDGPCQGQVELRPSLSGTGTPIPRCDGHWKKRLTLQDNLRKRYPEHKPADFDPAYAGESWEEAE